MIRCEAIEQFSLKDFNKLRNIKRKTVEKDGTLYVGDSFECDEDMAWYLTGKNEKGKIVVRILEIEPKEKGENKNGK